MSNESSVAKSKKELKEDIGELATNMLRLLKSEKLTNEEKRILLKILYKVAGPSIEMLEFWDLFDSDTRLNLLKHLSENAVWEARILAKLLYECLTKTVQ